MEASSVGNACQTPARKRSWVPSSVTNAYSTKRRRITLASVDLAREPDTASTSSLVRRESIGDRFIAARPDVTIPLNTTPRSRRMAKVFGLLDDRVLRHNDSNPLSPADKGHDSFRMNCSQLFAQPSKMSTMSAISNLGGRRSYLLALDGPGVPADPFAYPLTWSRKNVIAVACGKDVYHQDLDTRSIVHLCEIDRLKHGRPRSVQWSSVSPNKLAVGTTLGIVQLWNIDGRKMLRDWKDEEMKSVGGMDWRDRLLGVGVENGAINFYDDRKAKQVNRLHVHRSKVHGVKWSTDGNYLASSDQLGSVYVWDARAGKILNKSSKLGGRMQHNAPVKALAWCPWQPDLLATGSTFPDGKIRVFSVKSSAPIPEPESVLDLNTSITSLHWSPHCKEILSTHGHAWNPNTPYASGNSRPLQAKSPMTHSITVHTYPSYHRLVSVPAHIGPIGHSCLSPDATKVFTICPAEEAMKMWKVWNTQPVAPKKESVYDKFTIR